MLLTTDFMPQNYLGFILHSLIPLFSMFMYVYLTVIIGNSKKGDMKKLPIDLKY